MKQSITLCLTGLILFFATSLSLAAETESTLYPIYKTQTQTLSIPKLGVPAETSSYAYRVEMTLFSTDPIGFIVSSMENPVAITAEEAISALYQAETHSIYIPKVYIVDENDNISLLTEIHLRLGGDPFVWFYSGN